MKAPRRDLHLLAKPAGARCNLECTYCFFLSKEALYPGDRQCMDPETLDCYIHQLLESQASPDVNIIMQMPGATGPRAAG